MAEMVPLEAPAGSIIVMEGRVWHTSGSNVTADEDRALLFGYYTKPYLRPQWNFTASLAPERQAAMSPVLRYRLGLDATLNMAFNEVFGAPSDGAASRRIPSEHLRPSEYAAPRGPAPRTRAAPRTRMEGAGSVGVRRSAVAASRGTPARLRRRRGGDR